MFGSLGLGVFSQGKRWPWSEESDTAKPMPNSKANTPAASPWGLVLGALGSAAAERGLWGAHWTSLQKLLPVYRAITTVEVHSGNSTSFWDDCWVQENPLSEMFPALYIHAITQDAAVSDVLRDGLDHHLRPRRTRTAETERTHLLMLLKKCN